MNSHGAPDTRSKRKILVMGLPGSGKTTLSTFLAPLLKAVHFNADEARKVVSQDLGFDLEDRVEHARRMGWMCNQVTNGGHFAVADFICPTEETRSAFGAEAAFVVWVDRIKEGRFENTNALFVPPAAYDVRVTADGSPEYWAHKIYKALRHTFHPKQSTSLLVGRFQPFHKGHLALIKASLKRVGQVCIGVRDTQGTDEKNPLSFHEVRALIEAGLHDFDGHFTIIALPNITHIHYGRDVGYAIEQIDLDEELKKISATELRKKIYDPAMIGK